MGRILVLLLSLSAIGLALHSDEQPTEHRAKRGAASTSFPRWKLPVPYRIRDFDETEKAIIRKGISSISAKTCIDFKEDSSNDFMLQYVLASACQSKVGDSRRVYGPGGDRDHDVKLSKGCLTMGNVQHETAHALGIGHTQSRWDRDEYLFVDTTNIVEGYEPNFAKLFPKNSPTYGIPFEYGSRMMYPPYDYNIRPTPVLNPIPDESYLSSMGAAPEMTFYDWKILNMHYNCSAACSKPIQCQNGGYQHPRDCTRCICGDFHDGNNCEIERNVIVLKTETDENVQEVKTTGDYKSQILTIRDWSNFNVQPLRVIKAPENRRIRVTIDGNVAKMPMGGWVMKTQCPTPTCDYFGIEIADGDLKFTGRKFCCNSTSYLSQSNVIGFRAYSHLSETYEAKVTFKLEPESHTPATTTTISTPVPTTPTTPATTTTSSPTTTTTTSSPTTTTTTPATTTTTTATTTTTTSTTTTTPATTTTTTATTTTTPATTTTTTATTTSTPATTTTTPATTTTTSATTATTPPTTTTTPATTTTTSATTTTTLATTTTIPSITTATIQPIIPVKPLPEKPVFVDGQCVNWIVFTFDERTGLCLAKGTQICNDQDYEAAQEKSYANCKKNAPHITPDPPRTDCRVGKVYERVKGEPVDAIYGEKCKDDFCSYGSTCVIGGFPTNPYVLAHCCTIPRWS